MSNLRKLVANGTITIEELASIPELIECAKLVQNGLNACKKNISFPFGQQEREVYSYTGIAGEYESWGVLSHDGTFICYTNWGGNHENGRINLFNSQEVFMALQEETDFSDNLERFLREQIRKG